MNNVLIFDYDGVLIDSFDIFMKYFLDSCKINNISQISNKNEFLDIFNGNMYENMFKMGLSKEEILKVVLKVKEDLIKNQKKIKLFDGIDKILKKLNKNNTLIVVTSNDTEVVESYFNLNNLDVFDEIIGSDKEHSKIKKIEYIKTKYPNNNYFYFGDTTGDIIEGKKADVKTVAVSWGWHDKDMLESEKPDYLLNNPTDIFKIL